MARRDTRWALDVWLDLHRRAGRLEEPDPRVRISKLPAWAWTLSPGECQECQAYVPQLVRCRACGSPWVCDECSEKHECS